MSLAFLFIGIVLSFAFIGLYLWSYIQESPKKQWLVLAGISIVVGIVGFIVTS